MPSMNGFILTSDPTLRSQLEQALDQIPAFQLIHTGERQFPVAAVLRAFLQLHSPSVVFIDVIDMPGALHLAAIVGREAPHTQMAAISRCSESESILTAMQAGMREFLSLPVNVEEIRAILSRVQHTLETTPIPIRNTANVISFLPAKPGVGASTICLNTAAALARIPDQRVALLDFDLYSGAIDFMLNLGAGYSVRDAAEHAANLDEVIWQRHITKAGKLDVLRAGKPDPDRLPSASHMMSLVRHAQLHYKTVCIDLPGAADPASVETLRNSSHILLVTTGEAASIHMAARTVRLLRDQQLNDKLSIVLNRMDVHAPMNRLQIEETLHCEVIASIPNSYVLLQRALKAGQAVIEDGALGKRFAEFAGLLANPAQSDIGKPGVLSYINSLFGGSPAASARG